VLRNLGHPDGIVAPGDVFGRQREVFRRLNVDVDEAQVKMLPAKGKRVFRLLGKRGGKRFYFGSLASGKLSFQQLNAIESPFTCGFLFPGRIADAECYSSLFAALLGSGCRGIAIFSKSALDLEYVFDTTALKLLHFEEVDVGGMIWSTAHSSLEDTLDFLGIMTLSDAEPQQSAPVYLLQMNSDTLWDKCVQIWKLGLSSRGSNRGQSGGGVKQRHRRSSK